MTYRKLMNQNTLGGEFKVTAPLDTDTDGDSNTDNYL